jgi:flagellar assembly factor FliW
MNTAAGLGIRVTPHATPEIGAATTDAPETSRLQIRSRFASVDVDPKDVVTFPDGLPGYEGARQFVLLDVADLAPLKVLHAVGGSEPCFLVVDPKIVLPAYRSEISGADRTRLGAADDRGLVWLAIVAVQPGGEVTVNLRAPVVINPERMVGRQVMPNACVYPLQHVIERPT